MRQWSPVQQGYNTLLLPLCDGCVCNVSGKVSYPSIWDWSAAAMNCIHDDLLGFEVHVYTEVQRVGCLPYTCMPRCSGSLLRPPFYNVIHDLLSNIKVLMGSGWSSWSVARYILGPFISMFRKILRVDKTLDPSHPGGKVAPKFLFHGQNIHSQQPCCDAPHIWYSSAQISI